MGENTKIAWADHTWNPWQGCQRVSMGCMNCYMHRAKIRFNQEPYLVTRSKDATFNKPLKWKKPAKVFVCSWSDFFIEEADEWRRDAYDIISKTPHLNYLLLTKRPENIIGRWGAVQASCKNIWLGVTTENQKEADKRIPRLLKTPAHLRFLSMEPLLEEVDLNQNYFNGKFWGNEIGWAIIGAESGPNRRDCKIEWVRDIVRQCQDAGVPVFVKQLHINGKVSTNPEEWPEDLRIQEFPIQHNNNHMSQTTGEYDIRIK